MLRLENLEVGDYTFTLKVTDTAGQTSTADVHVFVKPGKSHLSSFERSNDAMYVFKAGITKNKRQFKTIALITLYLSNIWRISWFSFLLFFRT